MNFDELKDQIDAKLPKKDQKLLIYAFGILLLIIGWFLICSPLKTANDAQKLVIDQKEIQLAQYQQYDANKVQNKKATAKMQKELNEILERYPENVYEEDIVQAMSNLEANSDIEIDSITCEATNLVTSASDYSTDSANDSQSSADTASEDSTDADNDGTTDSTVSNENEYTLYCKSSTVTFNVGYEGIKEVAAFVKNGSLKKNIESISLAYDSETGRLTGTMIINFYSIKGEDVDNDVHEELPVVSQGLTNVFKTVD